MAAKQEDPRLLRALTDFEKELVKANNFLKQNSDSFRQSLVVLGEKASAIEQLAAANPENSKTIQRALEEKNLFGFYNQLSSALKELKKTVDSFEEQSLKTELLLESFRRERAYSFKDRQQLLGFVEQLSSLYAINKFAFRPEFLGLIDLNEVASELHLEKARQQLSIDASKLSKLFEFLEKKNAARNFHLDSAEIKLLVKNLLHLKLEAENATIKRADRLAKETGAQLD